MSCTAYRTACLCRGFNFISTTLRSMTSALFSAGLLPSRVVHTDDSTQRRLCAPNNGQIPNRGGLASCSQGHASHAWAMTSNDAVKGRPTRRQASVTMIEPEISAPETAKPSSAGNNTPSHHTFQTLSSPLSQQSDVSTVSQDSPCNAEVARTIVDLMTHGTLSTAGEDQIPLGTYASYVLDSQGQPILRLRKEAVHTTNLLRNPQCSLFIQPDDMPARILARATLIGKVSMQETPVCGAHQQCANHEDGMPGYSPLLWTDSSAFLLLTLRGCKSALTNMSSMHVSPEQDVLYR